MIPPPNELLAQLVDSESTHPKGIPTLKFFEDISVLTKDNPELASKFIEVLNVLHQKLRIMVQSWHTAKINMAKKEQDFIEAMRIAKIAKNPQGEDQVDEVLFKASECVYTKAKIKNPEKVLLWLGANVMVEFTADEAAGVLTKSLETARKSVEDLNKDIIFVKEQITYVEVAISRLHNYRVGLRQQQQGNPQ